MLRLLRMSSTSTGPVSTTIRQKLTEFFNPTHLEVECESHLHNVPKGAEKHFRVQIISDKFEGLSTLQRQRLVNKALAEELKTSVHALRIEARIPSEYEGQKQVDPPRCLGGGNR
uniref:BolA-like protein 1 n=1 Tax=Acrobeloides nanus TaxID=290746 RepID=A0A914DTU8_9BILA